jgi:hypothetical protein
VVRNFHCPEFGTQNRLWKSFLFFFGPPKKLITHLKDAKDEDDILKRKTWPILNVEDLNLF